jgi:lipoprotein signal peptidase
MRTPTQHPRRPVTIPARRHPGRRNDRQHAWIPALCLAVVLVDQITKAVRPAGTFVVNTGAPAFLPAALGDALWGDPARAKACDAVDTALLIAILHRARRLGTVVSRGAAAVVLVGLMSNLVDRLGTTAVFHPGLARGAVDWIPVPGCPPARTNVADLAIAVGVVALGHCALRSAWLSARRAAVGGPQSPETTPMTGSCPTESRAADPSSSGNQPPLRCRGGR